MIFKKLNMEYAAFDLDNILDLKQMLVENCEQKRDAGPMSDISDKSVLQSSNSSSVADFESQKGNKKKGVKGGQRREQSFVVRDSITALALCHNVTPTFPTPGIVEYQASSPDEVALVKFAESLEMRLIERD